MSNSWRTVLGSWVLIILLCPGALSAQQTTTQPSSTPELHWSNDDTDTTPSGLVFHGPFNNEAVKLTCNDLPAHDFVQVNVELLIIRSWDGSVPWESVKRPKTGPDYFRVRATDGPMLLSTTFSCLPNDPPGFDEVGKLQNFPSPIPGDRLPAWSGAALKNTMGYHYPELGPPALVPMDATYQLQLLLPHQGKSLQINLEALGLQNLLDESWGVSTVSFKPMAASQVSAPDDDKIATSFANALKAGTSATDVEKSGDPMEAVNTLVAGMDRTVFWIGHNVNPAALDGAAAFDAIAHLAGDDNHIEERNNAAPTLVAMGPSVEPFLRDARRISHGEQRVRIEAVLARLGTQTINDDNLRRITLATRVLEVIGTPEALKLRAQLVGMPNR